MRQHLKALARAILGNYRLNRIYTLDLTNYDVRLDKALDVRRVDTPQLIRQAKDSTIRSRAWYGGVGAFGFGLWIDDTLACLCHFWTTERFHDKKLWTLRNNEAIMVDLITTQHFRGRGLAPKLTQFAASELKKMGFERLYTWVWRSNTPSIRCFEKAGWSYVAFVVEIFPFGLPSSLRIVKRAQRPHR